MSTEIVICFIGLILTLFGLMITIKSAQRENAKEMKDFHGRLCTLEERYLQMMQRYLDEKNRN